MYTPTMYREHKLNTSEMRTTVIVKLHVDETIMMELIFHKLKEVVLTVTCFGLVNSYLVGASVCGFQTQCIIFMPTPGNAATCMHVSSEQCEVSLSLCA